MKSKYFSEFLGTAFLFCTVVGSGIMGENHRTKQKGRA